MTTTTTQTLHAPDPSLQARVSQLIEGLFGSDPDTEAERLALIESIRDDLHRVSPVRAMPVDRIRWVPIEMVSPNDYNPNSVAKVEMGLLITSILHDGYTQPVVTIWDAEQQKYVIIDGFHRYFCMRSNKDVHALTNGLLPIVVLEKSINDRMASTVRHNRARGKHSVQGMASMVFNMLENGWGDAEICNELGMAPEELLRLKHVTGFSKLFQNVEYRNAWITQNQIRIKKQAEEREKAGDGDNARQIAADYAAKQAKRKKKAPPTVAELEASEALDLTSDLTDDPV